MDPLEKRAIDPAVRWSQSQSTPVLLTQLEKMIATEFTAIDKQARAEECARLNLLRGANATLARPAGENGANIVSMCCADCGQPLDNHSGDRCAIAADERKQNAEIRRTIEARDRLDAIFKFWMGEATMHDYDWLLATAQELEPGDEDEDEEDYERSEEEKRRRRKRGG